MLSSEKLVALLAYDTPWHPIHVVATTGSTNADMAAGKYGQQPGTVLIAEHQSAGRGRFTRSWQAAPGQALATSLLVKPNRPTAEWGWLNLLIGMAVHDLFVSWAADVSRVGIKWPNDVLVDGRKISGILAERHGDLAICGFGVNVLMREQDLPVPTATSVLLAGFPIDPNALLAGILNRFADFYAQWDAGHDLSSEYLARSITIGQQVRVLADAELAPEAGVRGVAKGIDAKGALVVDVDGNEMTFSAGDVHHLR